ncbi:unnamed protein product [Moneuplotes crassus]|uniref:Uncharacterized protein n=1 Tax=Euplotes crassus TaxID=5936 RepID=A0AAD2DB94_EUPCR|nr:unnamed protein product [Moneuplotes crassus]
MKGNLYCLDKLFSVKYITLWQISLRLRRIIIKSSLIDPYSCCRKNSKNRADQFKSFHENVKINNGPEETHIYSIKKKRLPLKTIYKKYGEKLKNPESMMANRRLKKLKKKMKTKEKLINSLFYDPFKPLNLKSKILTQYDKPQPFGTPNGVPALRRQNQINQDYFSSHLPHPKISKSTNNVVSEIRATSLDFKFPVKANDNDSIISNNSEEEILEKNTNQDSTSLKRSHDAACNTTNEKKFRNGAQLFNLMTEINSTPTPQNVRRSRFRTTLVDRPNIPKPSRILTHLAKEEDEIDKMMYKYSNLNARMKKCKDRVLNERKNPSRNILVLKQKNSVTKESLKEGDHAIADLNKDENMMKNTIKNIVKAIVLTRNTKTNEIQDFTLNRRLGEKRKTRKIKILENVSTSINNQFLDEGSPMMPSISVHQVDEKQKRKDVISYSKLPATLSMNTINLRSMTPSSL